MRAFLGLQIPEAVSVSLDAALARPRRELPAASWVPARNRHLTLVFLGATGDSKLLGLDALIAPVFGAASPIELELEDCGTFPVARPARAVWMGFRPSRALLELQKAVAEVCRTVGYDLDQRPYTPHLTLARCRERWPRRACEAWASAFPAGVGAILRCGGFTADRACLFESQQEPRGVTYRVIQSYPLAGRLEPVRIIETT